MNQDELKLRIGANITQQRKRLGMTQAELAQKLNYSDKAVSKWERGESVPDVLTLAEIARQFGVTVNDLIYGTPETEQAPQEPLPEPQPQPVPEAEPKPKILNPELIRITRHNRRIIQGLVSVLVWLVALAVYVVLDGFHVSHAWLIFFAAVPANAITLLSLRSAWKMYGWNMVLVSVIMWGSLIFLHIITYLLSSVNIWRMFLAGALGQAAIILWFKLLKKPKEEKHG